MINQFIFFGILLIAIFLALYFGIRFYLMKKALKSVSKELSEIQTDLAENHILHLPFPDVDMEILLNTINSSLEKIREERISYAQKERRFQSQIEAVSHDLRTPLTVILGYLKLMQNPKKHASYTDEQKEMLNILTRKAHVLETLVTQLYDYSRLNANDYELNMEEIDAGRILREVFSDNCLMFENAHLQVITEFADHPVRIMGEKDALERIFTNLLQNAERYANSFLKISVREVEKHLQIIFENDTNKLTEKDIPLLFERFYMNDNSRNQDRSGLGLTIARGLAEEMGGTLEAEMIHPSSVPEIVRFRLCFISAS